MENCIKEILLGIDCVERIGYPGRIIVFGTNATAVITGRYEEDTVIAAAEFGKGRVVVFSHTAYGKQMVDQTGDFANSTLYQNMRNWVTNKDQNVGYNILKIDSSQPVKTLNDLQKYNILFTIGGKECVNKELIEKYIESGGALVVAVTPWGWIQCNSNRPVYEIPYCSILLKMGISFSKDMAKYHDSGFYPAMNKAATANLSRMSNNFQGIDTMLKKTDLLKMINELPMQYYDTLSKSVTKYWKEVESIIKKVFPHENINTKSMHEKELLEFWAFCANMQKRSDIKAPYIKEFPGDFDAPPPMTSKTVKFNSKLEDFFFTGCYVAAGTEASLKVVAIKQPWKIFIGAHTDYLTSVKVSRWPDIVKRIDVSGMNTYNISSPFGGGVYFVSSKSIDSKIEATIHNIVLQPLYDFRVTNSKDSWKENRDYSGIWADIIGKHIAFTFPSKSIRNLEDPTESVILFDKLLEAYHDLRGTNIADHRKIWIVADKQPSAGYMHAGYPIVTHLDVTRPNEKNFLLDADNFKEGAFWGLFHEIGHNMQKSEWTFEGTSEVTVNIFTLYGMHTMCDLSTWIHPWLQKQLRGASKYLKDGADFAKWKRQPGVALVIYAQLAHYFNWDAYKKVFRYYNKLLPNRKPKNNQDKIDMWFVTFSRVVHYNLEPLAMFWGISLSEVETKKLQDLKLTYFLPNDEVTREAPERVSLVKERFPNLLQELEPF